MGPGSSFIRDSPHPRRDWIVGAVVVAVFGTGCLVAELGVALAVQPLLKGMIPGVVGLTFRPWVLGVAWFSFFDLPRLALFAGAMFGLSLLSRGGFRRFFWGFPVAALGLVFAITWPDRPTGLASAALQAHDIVRWSVLGAVLIAVVASSLYSRARRRGRRLDARGQSESG